jgi:hypothetical protein
VKSKITIIYIDAGGGHRAAANALADVIREQDRPWDVRMLCIQDLLHTIDFIRKSTGIPFQDVYNIMLRRGWTLGSAHLIPLMHLLIRLSHRLQVEVLEKCWRSGRPDMVISLIPHYNRALKESLENVWPGTPYVTILTDIADYPPHFWIERQDQYVVCGSEEAVRQAREIGMPEPRILRTSGMILHPRFYTTGRVDREVARQRIGLRPDLPTGLVLFGGEGSADIVKIARALNRPGSRLQLILICGRHERAAAQLRALPKHIPMFVEGFTRDVPHYMEIADFLIGKPGPGSISEALTKGLPVIVQRNAWTLAHERFNAAWVEQQGVGMAFHRFGELFSLVEKLSSPERFAEMRDRVRRSRNLAVYEIPDLLEDILCGRLARGAEFPAAEDKPARPKGPTQMTIPRWLSLPNPKRRPGARPAAAVHPGGGRG